MLKTMACVMMMLFTSISIGADWKTRLPNPDKIPEYLLDVSVSIAIDGRELGSGTLITIPTGDKDISFILTAAHVVSQLRNVEEVIDPKTGTKRQIARFKDCQLSREFREDGRKVGSTNMDCRVQKYDEKEDIAILRIRAKNYTKASIVFYPNMDPPRITTKLLHCGSLAGSLGAQSITPGIIAQVGRVIGNVGQDKVYDQTTVTARGGSSGGAVIREIDGAYIGMLVIGVQGGDTFNFIIPIRRIHVWTQKVGLEWLINPELKSPTEEQLDEMPIEEVGAKFQDNSRDRNSISPNTYPKPEHLEYFDMNKRYLKSIGRLC